MDGKSGGTASIQGPAPDPDTIGEIVEIDHLVGSAWFLTDADQVSGLKRHVTRFQFLLLKHLPEGQ
jgi:hypothetical protein